MAKFHGKDGLVHADDVNIANITQWDLSEDTEVADGTVMGDDWKTHLAGHKSWNGSATVRLDKSDAGQTSLANGASVVLKLYSEGNASGQKYYTGPATVTSVSRPQSMSDVAEASFTFTGNGALTEGTVT